MMNKENTEVKEEVVTPLQALEVKEVGDRIVEVVNIRNFSTDDKSTSENGIILIPNYEAAVLKMRVGLVTGQRIFILVDESTDISKPSDYNTQLYKVFLGEDEISAYKSYCINQVQTEIDKLSGEHIMDIYRAVRLSSKFAEYGIFINDSNKEEMYIEIIQQEAPELIDLLQDYLYLVNLLDPVLAGERRLQEKKVKLEKCESIQELNDVINDK